MTNDRAPKGLITIKELRERPRITWLVENVLPERSLVEVYGLQGSYKTFVWLDVGLCIATGKPWHGCAVRQAPVVYITGESNDKLQPRLDAWYFAHRWDAESSLLVPFYMTERGYSIYDEREVDDVLGFMDHAEVVPGMVVYDTLGACSGGGRHPYNENDNSDFHVVRANMARIRDATGATVVLVAHESESIHQKTGRKYPSGWPRGASAQKGDMDVLIQMSAKPHLTKLGGSVTLRNTKPRENAPFADIKLETLPQRLPDGQSSLLVHGTARPLRKAAAEVGPQDLTRPEVRAALRVLGHAKPTQVAEYLHSNRKRTQWHLNQMVRDGEAVREHGVYRLAEQAAAA